MSKLLKCNFNESYLNLCISLNVLNSKEVKPFALQLRWLKKSTQSKSEMRLTLYSLNRNLESSACGGAGGEDPGGRRVKVRTQVSVGAIGSHRSMSVVEGAIRSSRVWAGELGGWAGAVPDERGSTLTVYPQIKL